MAKKINIPSANPKGRKVKKDYYCNNSLIFEFTHIICIVLGPLHMKSVNPGGSAPILKHAWKTQYSARALDTKLTFYFCFLFWQQTKVLVY